jgi:hypothetical protein
MPSPENVCMRTEMEFLLRIRPASKNPSAGVIIMTRPVAISIHVVSPVSIVNAIKIWNPVG